MSRVLSLLVLLALLPFGALAQSVSLQGMMSGKALLIVDGSPPKPVGAGETHRGVKVISTSGEQALVEIDGKRHTLRVGDQQVSVGGSGGGSRGSKIVLPVSSGGHFTTQGTINGKSVQFMVDTGATTVSMSVTDAERIGLDYKSGVAGRASTANGIISVWRVRLASVRIGDVEIFDVEGTVLPAGMPYVLLGNSFLSRFQMKRDNDLLVLERRF